MPTWKHFISVFRFLGKQFKAIEEIRASNAQMLEMIHKKILEDYELIEKQIYDTGRDIEEAEEILQNLKNEQQKL